MNADLQNWANIATIVTAGVAVLALFGAIWQVCVGRTGQREATASELYGNYLILAVAHPMLAGGHVSVPADGRVNEEFERYEWFVSVMLHAFEQILELTEGDEVWLKAIADQILYHKSYLANPRFVPVHYSQALRRLFPEQRKS